MKGEEGRRKEEEDEDEEEVEEEVMVGRVFTVIDCKSM